MVSAAIEPLIEVQSVSAVFSNGDSGLRALDEVSFKLFPQEFLCILGPSGSGKSTLLRLLAGLLLPTTGRILFRGESIQKPQQGLGIVFQKANLMPWRTVLENITLPLEIKRVPKEQAVVSALQMIELVGLTGFENALPRDLSGGMAQRVAIGRALVHNPAVLLLDEPFGSLDALTREKMGTELLRIWQKSNQTIVMVTHSISEAIFLADRILVISGHPGQLRLDLEVERIQPRNEADRYSVMVAQMAAQIRSAIGDPE